MRLNPNCVRDLLLDIEENSGLRKTAIFVDEYLLNKTSNFFGEDTEIPAHQKKLLEKYSCDELIYHVNYCAEAGLITISDLSSEVTIYVSDLTPLGHDFISNIRANNNWKKTLDIGGKIGTYSLNMLSKIAEGVVTALMKQQLGVL